MKKAVRFRIRLLAAALVVIVAAAAAVVIFGSRAAATSNGGPAMLIEPGNLRALNTAANAIPGVPPQARDLGSAQVPAPGSVHRLGHGAIAWPYANQVCWNDGTGGGCIMPSTRAIDPVISDPDGFRSGKPARVSGVAVDAVSKVTVTLKDGSKLSAEPVDNWYEIVLPVSAAPWDVTRVTALDANGNEIVGYDTPTTPLTQ